MAGWRLLAIACALSGCDTAWGLGHLYECPVDDDDCDQLLDKLDPCPADFGGDADEDRDGVGDECDPNLATPSDGLLEFEGFAVKDARWTERGAAAWSVRDSALALDNGVVNRAVPTNSRPTVEVFLDPEFAAEGGFASVFVASEASTGIPLECRVEHHAAGDELVMSLLDKNTLAPILEIGRAKGLPGTPLDGLRVYGGQLPSLVVRCRARYGASDALYLDWDSWTTRVDFDTIGFRVQEARADYRALAIYTTTP